ncbi:META domain-containing protein [Hymenobacter taeanensis]|uniref:META domain-containing protein n=1 Tax=Hymenobacter taeanensis TaxID=2735321 RepID=A0A6M6BGG1_9BACT|nr:MULTISPECIES: META domain-containing protein [Hymenobacter]QJX46333.1 META domain-containing protein [Hymenobacter taeanensis]UOQ80192.1 META domain-containing protein [Hymenobacter sp. 5414T-23]
MFRSVLSCLALSLSLVLSSCTKGDEPVPAPVYLLDQRWVLTEIKGKETPKNATADLLLQAASNAYICHSYCNQLMGTYELAAGTPALHFPTGGSTFALCNEIEAETAYSAALHQTARYVISNRTLRLYGAESGQPLLVFRAAD